VVDGRLEEASTITGPPMFGLGTTLADRIWGLGVYPSEKQQARRLLTIRVCDSGIPNPVQIGGQNCRQERPSKVIFLPLTLRRVLFLRFTRLLKVM